MEYTRSDAILSAARDNLTADLMDLAVAINTRMEPLLDVARKARKDPDYRVDLAAANRALRAATAVSDTEREAAVSVAADLRLAGVSRREVARAVGVSEQALSAALSAYPVARVTKKADLLWDESAKRWRAQAG